MPGLNFVDFGVADLYQALESAQHAQVGECIPLVFKDQEQATYPSVFHAYIHGASVVVNHVEVAYPPLLEWCRRLRDFLPHAYMQLYLTPPGSQTVRPHSDDRDVLLLQCIGSKHWQVMEPPIPFPYSNEQLGKQRAMAADELPETVLSCTVNPGDVLYMPRGFVHMGQSTPDGPSLHLTVAIATHDWSYATLLAGLALNACEGVLPPGESPCDAADGGSEDDVAVAPTRESFASLDFEAEEDAASLVLEAQKIIRSLPLELCRTTSEVASAVREGLDKHVRFRRAVPLDVYFGRTSIAESGAEPPEEVRETSSPEREALVSALVAGFSMEALGPAYRQRLVKHNAWHDEVWAHWSGHRSPEYRGSGGEEAEQPWRLPPRLDDRVRLGKRGKIRFSCVLSEAYDNLKVTFVNEKDQYLELYALPAYLDVMKFVESRPGAFSVSELPAPDAIGQICFAAVLLHNGIFVDV